MKRTKCLACYCLLLSILLILSGCIEPTTNDDTSSQTASITSNLSSEEEPTSSETITEPSSEPLSSDMSLVVSTSSNITASTTSTTSIIPPHEHIYTTKVVTATCTTDGYTLHTCKCGYSYKNKSVYRIGHLYGSWKVVTYATTESEGKKECSCKRCGHKLSETIPKRAEKYANIPIYITVVEEPSYIDYDYSGHHIAVVDRRTWGNVPTITIHNETSLHVVYYNKAGEKVEFDVTKIDGYFVTGIIKDDGTYTNRINGGFGN